MQFCSATICKFFWESSFFSLFTQVSGTDGCEIVLNLPASSSPSSSAAAGGSPAEFYAPKLSLPLLIVKKKRLFSGLFRRPEGLLTQRIIKEARKTGWNRRAPASSPPLPLGTRLSGPPSPRRPLLPPCRSTALTFTMTGRDCSGLTPDQNPAQQPRGRSLLPEPIKIRACGRTAPTRSVGVASRGP